MGDNGTSCEAAFIQVKDLAPDGTVIVALTANAIIGAKDAYLEAGFDDYLSKPVDVDSLEGMLEKHLPADIVEWRVSELGRTNEKAPADGKTAGAPDEEAAPGAALPMKLEKLKGIGLSVEDGLRYCGGEEEFYTEMLLELVETIGAKSRELEQDLESEDWKQYQIHAHALKSNFKSVGAMEMFREAKALEDAAREADTGYLRAEHGRFVEDCCALADALRAIFAISANV